MNISNRQYIAKKNRRVPTILKPSLIALSIMHSVNTQAAAIHVGGNLGQGCGLSAAILSANQDAALAGSQCIAGDGDDIIELHRDITIRQSWKDDDNGVKVDTFTGMPLITSSISINGNGHAISRDPSAPEFRLLRSGYNTQLSLNELTLQNGQPNQQAGSQDYFRFNGGAVLAKGGLSLNNSRILGNENAIFVTGDGDIQITNSEFINNRIGRPGFTTAAAVQSNIYNDSALYIKNSQFENNQGTPIASQESSGTPYNAGGNVNIIDSSISNNSGAGVKIGRSLGVEISNTVITGNAGRGLEMLGTIGSIKDSVISNNVDTECAGIHIVGDSTAFYGPFQSSMTISNSSIFE